MYRVAVLSHTCDCADTWVGTMGVLEGTRLWDMACLRRHLQITFDFRPLCSCATSMARIRAAQARHLSPCHSYPGQHGMHAGDTVLPASRVRISGTEPHSPVYIYDALDACEMGPVRQFRKNPGTVCKLYHAENKDKLFF